MYLLGQRARCINNSGHKYTIMLEFVCTLKYGLLLHSIPCCRHGPAGKKEYNQILDKLQNQVKRQDAAILKMDAVQMENTRNRNKAHREELEKQIKLDEAKNLEGSTMSTRERALNMDLIAKAKEVIHEPKILQLRSHRR